MFKGNRLRVDAPLSEDVEGDGDGDGEVRVKMLFSTSVFDDDLISSDV